MQKIIQIGQIILGLGVAYVISAFLFSEIFLGNSPTIRPHLDTYLAKRVQTIVNPVSNFVAQLRGGNPTHIVDTATVAERAVELEKVPFAQIAVGVAAHEREGVSETTYDMKKIKWVPVTIKGKNGQPINLFIPEGTKPPPDGIL